jgi:hypothetical protein
MIREIAFGGWSRCVELSNGHLRLVATLEVGPRVLFCGAPSGPNLFKEFKEQEGQRQPASPHPQSGNWMAWGGHRLWVAPEGDYCYAADNQPVGFETLDEHTIRLTTPDETLEGWRRSMEFRMIPGEARVQVIHRLTALRDLEHAVAPWGLSMMDVGGVAIVPQPKLGSHPEDLLPNRNLVVWPYVSLQDPRLSLGAVNWLVRQDCTRGALKIGLLHQSDRIAYHNKGWLFITTVPFVTRGAAATEIVYPDYGVNCEIFTNQDILEMETLAPLTRLRAGETATHAVEWCIRPHADESVDWTTQRF